MSEAVERLLAGRIGLDLSTVGETLIRRGIQIRMTALGLHDPEAYEQVLLRSEPEQQALVEEIVIPESWFFRDDRPFRLLRDRAGSGWISHPERSPMRILSLPCAGGEEPYSIAISLLDAGLPAHRFHVDAVDVSQRCVDRARAGVYGVNAFRGHAMPTVSDHFLPHWSGGMEVDRRVRQTVAFHRGNLLDPLLLADVAPYDVVFCRNLLIYFDAPARSRAFDGLARLLVTDGILFLGHADRNSDLRRFEPIEDRGCFAFRRVVPGLEPFAPPAPVACPQPSPAANRVPPPIRATPRPVPTASPGPAPASPAGSPRVDPVASPASPRKLLENASELADQGKLDEATRLCERAIRDGGPTARAYFLLGIIRQAAGDRNRAEAHFQRAVYLDAQHDEALLALAILARRRGDVAAETAYRRRADRARSRKEPS